MSLRETKVSLARQGERVLATTWDRWTLDIGDGPVDCRTFDVPSLAGEHASATRIEAHLRSDVGRAHRIGPERVHATTGAVDGAVTTGWALELPELRAGDRALVEVERTVDVTDIGLAWRPGERGSARYAWLEVDGLSDVGWEVHGLAGAGPSAAVPNRVRRGKVLWVREDVPDGRSIDGRGPAWWGEQILLVPTGTPAVPTADLTDLGSRLSEPWTEPGVRVLAGLPPPPGDPAERGWATPREAAERIAAAGRAAGRGSVAVALSTPRGAGWGRPIAAWADAAVVVPTAGAWRLAWSSAGDLDPGEPLMLAPLDGGEVVSVRVPDQALTVVGTVASGVLTVRSSLAGTPTERPVLDGLRLGAVIGLPSPPAPPTDRAWLGYPHHLLAAIEVAHPGPASAFEGSGAGGGLRWEVACGGPEGLLRCAVRIDDGGGAVLAEREAARAEAEAALRVALSRPFDVGSGVSSPSSESSPVVPTGGPTSSIDDGGPLPTPSTTLFTRVELAFPVDDPTRAFWDDAGSTVVEHRERSPVSVEPLPRAIAVPPDATSPWLSATLGGRELAPVAVDGGFVVVPPAGAAGAMLELSWGWGRPGVDSASSLRPAGATGAERWTLQVVAPGAVLMGNVDGAEVPVVFGGDTFSVELTDLPPQPAFAVESPVVSWRVAEVNGVAVLPDRDALLDGIAQPAVHASMPEPGLPTRLKWMREEAVPEVLDLVRSETTTAIPHGVEPLRPRKLIAARRSGWATPWEQSLILARYLGQLRLDAVPVPVRPVSAGATDPASPAAVTEAVVRLRDDQGERWLDPACPVCAVGELRPLLGDAQAFDRETSQLPPAAAGVQRRTLVLSEGDTGWAGSMRVRLEGSAAVALRLDLLDVPIERRADWLCQRFASGGRLVGVEGLASLGAPIVLEIADIARAHHALALDVPLDGAEGPGLGPALLPWNGELQDVVVLEGTAGTDLDVLAGESRHGDLTWQRDIQIEEIDTIVVDRYVLPTRSVAPDDLNGLVMDAYGGMWPLR